MHINQSPATSAGCIQSSDRFEAVNWPFRIVAIDGRELGQFDQLADALAAFNLEEQAAAVSIGNYIVTRRREGRIA